MTRVRLRSGWFALGLLLAAGCSSNSDVPIPIAPHDAGSDADASDAGPRTFGEQTFGDFEPWASPIDDYLAVGEKYQPSGFNRAITDLAPMGERMYMGYGDGTYNLGEHVPIEIRYFASSTDPTAAPAPIDGAGQGEAQTTPYQSGEEQIDRFRMLDGSLWQAGVDSIDADELYTQAHTVPKSIQGNVYDLQGDTWKKHRTIGGGEHVQDVGGFQDAVFAVGSGADTRKEFEAGQIFRYLWRSTDHAATFETVKRVQVTTPGKGDTRWVHLLPTSGTLFLFGYESDFDSNTAVAHNAAFDGKTVTDLTTSAPLGRVYPDGTLALADGTGVLHGVAITAKPVHYTAGIVRYDGSFTTLSSLVGSTVLDLALTDTGELLYLVSAGDSYGAPPVSFDVRVLVADAATPDSTKELVHFMTDVRPTSIAGWQGALFLGTNDGKVLRATAKT